MKVAFLRLVFREFVLFGRTRHDLLVRSVFPRAVPLDEHAVDLDAGGEARPSLSFLVRTTMGRVDDPVQLANCPQYVVEVASHFSLEKQRVVTLRPHLMGVGTLTLVHPQRVPRRSESMLRRRVIVDNGRYEWWSRLVRSRS